MNLTADTLAEAIVVRNVPNTTVFDISVSSDRSNVAARIANFLAEAHIRRSEAARMKRMKAALRWLDQQAEETQFALREAENEVAKFSAKMAGESKHQKATRSRLLKCGNSEWRHD